MRRAPLREANTRSGELYFSTNLRTFRLDPGLASDPGCADITAHTLPDDFRDRRVHHALRIAA